MFTTEKPIFSNPFNLLARLVHHAPTLVKVTGHGNMLAMLLQASGALPYRFELLNCLVAPHNIDGVDPIVLCQGDHLPPQD